MSHYQKISSSLVKSRKNRLNIINFPINFSLGYPINFSLGCTSGNWYCHCKLTLPTPPMQLNCHADNVFGWSRAFALSFSKSPSVLLLIKALLYYVQREKLSRYNGPFLDTQGFTSLTHITLMMAADNQYQLWGRYVAEQDCARKHYTLTWSNIRKYSHQILYI